MSSSEDTSNQGLGNIIARFFTMKSHLVSIDEWDHQQQS